MLSLLILVTVTNIPTDVPQSPRQALIDVGLEEVVLGDRVKDCYEYNATAMGGYKVEGRVCCGGYKPCSFTFGLVTNRPWPQRMDAPTEP